LVVTVEYTEEPLEAVEEALVYRFIREPPAAFALELNRS
jgi:hypothetical protein